MLRRILLSAGVLMGLCSCASPSVTGEVTGEPVCPDFVLGGAENLMKGSLRQPIQLTVVEDGDVRWQRVLLGKRLASNPASKFVVEDDDDTYIMRWTQCPNTFAPKRVDAAVGPASQFGSSYTCGEAKPYKEVELKVVEGDPSSRVIAWQTPPEPACWTGVAAAAPDASADSAAPDASADSAVPDASADSKVDAGPAASGSAAPSAAAPSASAAAAASAKTGAGSAPQPRNTAKEESPASSAATP